MGGHGGLNILPHKSWNVYGQKQRDRVRRDEDAHAARIAEERAEALDAARDERLGQLRRAKVERAGEDAGRDSRGHVNLFAEEEAAAARDGGRNKMNKTTTLAAHGEDERLRFGGRDDAGERNAPWYASASGQGGTAYESLPARIRRDREEESALRKLSSKSRVQALAVAPSSLMVKRSRDAADDQRRRESKRTKEKKRKKSSRDDDDAIRRLREERIAREERDSRRERALTDSSRSNDDAYRSGYGYQPPNKRSHRHT